MINNGMIQRTVGTVYIRGLAFKARAGGRRQMVLLQLKKLDEGDSDLWLLKYGVAAAIGIATFELLEYFVPMI